MFWNKPTYVDYLEEWRKVKVFDFNMFDKVTIDREEGIWLVLSGWSYNDTTTYIKCINLEGKDNTFYAKDVKKYYGEFQEEFDALDLIEKNKQELEIRKKKIKDLENKYKEDIQLEAQKLQEIQDSLEENYKKTKKIQGKNFKDLGII